MEPEDQDKDRLQYRAGDIEEWEPSEPSEALAKEAILQFDGWLEHLERWQVDSIADDIARVYSAHMEDR